MFLCADLTLGSAAKRRSVIRDLLQPRVVSPTKQQQLKKISHLKGPFCYCFIYKKKTRIIKNQISVMKCFSAVIRAVPAQMSRVGVVDLCA